MSARRVRPVLYEVARRAHRPGEPLHKGPTLLAPHPPESSAPAEPGLVTEGEVEGMGWRARAASLLPQFAVREGGVVVGLAWPAAVTCGAVLLVLLALVFDFGRRTGPAPARNDDLGFLTLAPAQGEPERDPCSDAGSRVATPLRARPTAEPQSPERQPERSSESPPGAQATDTLRPKPGYSYLVIQHFPSRAAKAAGAARDYLRSNGVPCVLVQRGRDLVLVGTDGFELRSGRNANAAEKARADGLIQRVKDLGKAYASQGYSFDQCYLELAR